MEYWTNSAPRCAAESLPRPSMAVRQPFAGANCKAAVESLKTHGTTQETRQLSNSWLGGYTLGFPGWILSLTASSP